MLIALRISAGLAVLAALGLAGAADEPPKPEPHQTFGPVVRPKVPDVKGAARTDVDRFILAALEAKQLALNPEADRATLIRRVCFDLTGLPPTVAEIEQFTADKSPNAYEKMVDRYLASPHYGERWGKVWLDAAGYADSNGYFNADSDRPLAWKYRDYVIKSLNADKPYDRFVREQIAGDELAGYAPSADVTTAMVEALTATHFLRNAPDGTGESDGNPDEVRTDRFTVLEGNVQNLINCLLGVTVQCARCHDHKFEPVTQAEYYGLQAILFPVYNPEKWSKPNDRVVSVGAAAELAAAQRKNQLIDRQVKAAKDGLTAVADPLHEQFLDERLKDLDAPTRAGVIAAVKAAKRTPAQQALVKAHPKAEISDDHLAKRFPEYAALRDRVKQTIAEREKDRPKPAEQIAAFVETDPKPAVHHILKRGSHDQPGDEVQPGVPAALDTAKNPFTVTPRPVGRVSTGRRTALANWVTSPENPLFSRVMVNRIWQHHFGTGIVTTPDNLGLSGAKPSHPELLDCLAAEFIHSGWNVKALHRLILRSAVYRQSSGMRNAERGTRNGSHDTVAAVVGAGIPHSAFRIPHSEDPDNRLLAHFPLRRLDAEAVRDAMLHVSGELDTRAGGPYVPSKYTPEGVVEIEEKTPGAHRRSVYLQQRRTQVVTFLQLFDSPTIVSTCGKRTPSTVPLQSLAMLNSEFARARARAFAARLAREAGDDPAKRLALAYRLACSREPLKSEVAVCEKFLDKQRDVYANAKDADAWTDLCQIILASNTFLYVE